MPGTTTRNGWCPYKRMDAHTTHGMGLEFFAARCHVCRAWWRRFTSSSHRLIISSFAARELRVRFGCIAPATGLAGPIGTLPFGAGNKTVSSSLMWTVNQPRLGAGSTTAVSLESNVTAPGGDQHQQQRLAKETIVPPRAFSAGGPRGHGGCGFAYAGYHFHRQRQPGADLCLAPTSTATARRIFLSAAARVVGGESRAAGTFSGDHRAGDRIRRHFGHEPIFTITVTPGDHLGAVFASARLREPERHQTDHRPNALATKRYEPAASSDPIAALTIAGYRDAARTR